MGAITAIFVAVSEPHPFTYAGDNYAFADIRQADHDVTRLEIRLSTLAELAGCQWQSQSLVAQHATREAVLHALTIALDCVETGGYLIFVVQGHATDVPDLNRDEAALGHSQDQIFPTATGPILDDDLWALWQTRPDITIFTITDTCRAETLTVQVEPDRSTWRKAGVIIGGDAARTEQVVPVVKIVTTTAGPNIIQFAASSRGTDAYDIDLGGALSGRLTQAILNATLNHNNLRSYLTWFHAAAAEIVTGTPPQQPALYFLGPNAHLLEQPPPFATQ